MFEPSQLAVYFPEIEIAIAGMHRELQTWRPLPPELCLSRFEVSDHGNLRFSENKQELENSLSKK